MKMRAFLTIDFEGDFVEVREWADKLDRLQARLHDEGYENVQLDVKERRDRSPPGDAPMPRFRKRVVA